MSQPARHDPYASLRVVNFRWFISRLLVMTVATLLVVLITAIKVPSLRRLREIR